MTSCVGICSVEPYKIIRGLDTYLSRDVARVTKGGLDHEIVGAQVGNQGEKQVIKAITLIHHEVLSRENKGCVYSYRDWRGEKIYGWNV